MRSSTWPGLRPPRHLEEQRMFTTPYNPSTRLLSLLRWCSPKGTTLLKRFRPRTFLLPAAPKGVEQTSTTVKEKENPKEVSPEILKTSIAPKDSSKGGVVSQSHELVSTTFPIPAKEELKGKGPASSAATTAQPAKTPKDKLVIKMKPWVVSSSFFSFSFFFFELLFLFPRFVINLLFCNLFAFFWGSA